MISERKLKRWRKEALIFNNISITDCKYISQQDFYDKLKETNIRIIKMTQELIDQHLLSGGKK